MSACQFVAQLLSDSGRFGIRFEKKWHDISPNLESGSFFENCVIRVQCISKYQINGIFGIIPVAWTNLPFKK